MNAIIDNEVRFQFTKHRLLSRIDIFRAKPYDESKSLT